MTAATLQSDRSLDRMVVGERERASRSRGRTVASDDAPADELYTNSRPKLNNSHSVPRNLDDQTAESIPGIFRSYSNKDKLQCEYYKEDKTLTDGELPSLSLPIRRMASNVSAASSVSSIRARRLSPNSKNKHRAFWNQLDVEEEESDDDGKGPGRTKARHAKNDAQLVDNDEDGGGFISVILNICSVFGSQEDSHNAGAPYVSPDSNLKKRNYDDDYELETAPKRPSGKKSQKSQNRGLYHPSSATSYDEDENTAIEVEYVHQNYDDENSISSGQNKFLQLDDSGQVASYISREKKRDDVDTASSLANDKNAYLRALATKAKEDFRRKKGLPEQNQTENVNRLVLEQNQTEYADSSRHIDSNVDWNRPEFEGWSHSDKERYLELLQTNSPKDAMAIIASSQTLQVEPTDKSRANMNLPIMYSTIEEDRDSVMLARSVVSDLSMSSAFRSKKLAYSSIKDSQFKPRGIILNEDGQRFDDRASDSETNIKLASNLLSNLSKRKDGKWLEIQENVDAENTDQGIADSMGERRGPSSGETRAPSLSIQIKDATPQSYSSNIQSITLDPYRDSSEASVIASPLGGADAMSVMSGSRSVYTTDTNATGASSWSVRSRRRPKGAAKKRIHEDHSIEQKKPAGWVETIQAVAEKTNQVWDPNLGWVNYSEPEKPVYELGSDRIGPLNPPINSKSYEEVVGEEDAKSRSSHVPFPTNWEREREAMIKHVDYISVTESEATTRHSNAPRLSNKPLLLKKVGSFRNERNSEHLLNVEEEDEELDDIFSIGVNAETDHRADKYNTNKKTSPPMETPEAENTSDTKSLYDWIDQSGKQHTFEDRVYLKRQDMRDFSENASEVLSQADSIEMSRLEGKDFAKTVDEKQMRYDFRGMRIKEMAPESEPYKFSSHEAERPGDILSFPDPTESDRSDRNFQEQQKRYDVRGIKPTLNNDDFIHSSDRRYKDQWLEDENVRNELLENRNEDDDPFTQDNNSYFGDENSDVKFSQSGSFENGFRVIKTSRNMSDFMNDGNQSKGPFTSKNRKEESDTRSISSQDSYLDKAQQWRKKLEHEKASHQEQAPAIVGAINKAEVDDPVFVSAADDSSTFDFPEQRQRTDPQLVFKRTNVELRRKQGGTSAQAKKALMNPKDTLKIRSVNVHERHSLPNDFSSVSSVSRDLSNVRDENFGLNSILSRLQACVPDSSHAASHIDICPNPSSTHRERKSDDQELPQAHLDFLQSSRMKPPIQNGLASSGLLVSFCGRPDTIFEEEEEEVTRTNDLSALRSKVKAPSGIGITESRDIHAQIQSSKALSVRETNANNAAPPAQFTNGISHSKSEKWQQFMDKRSSSNASISSNKSSVSDISKAAEKFAARKVAEIMNEFNNDVNNGQIESSDKLVRSRSAKAAEDLAAARVQAMLMSSHDSGEC